MNIYIKRTQDWLKAHPKAKQWAWFITLWGSGLCAVAAISYPIKWLIRSMG